MRNLRRHKHSVHNTSIAVIHSSLVGLMYFPWAYHLLLPPSLGIWPYLQLLWVSLIAQLVKNLPAMQETPVGFLGWEDPLKKGQDIHSSIMGFPVTQMVKNPPAMQETWVQSLGWQDPLEEGMATHSSILPWRIPMDIGAWRATVHGVTKSRTRLHN